MSKREPYSVWEEAWLSGVILNHLRMARHPHPHPAAGNHLRWSRAKLMVRLRINSLVTNHVLGLAGATDEQMRTLSLARLLDVARQPTPEKRAITLSYILFGRRPAWADR